MLNQNILVDLYSSGNATCINIVACKKRAWVLGKICCGCTLPSTPVAALLESAVILKACEPIGPCHV